MIDSNQNINTQTIVGCRSPINEMAPLAFDRLLHSMFTFQIRDHNWTQASDYVDSVD